ncbi:MAG: hypothetical protein M3Y49_11795 [Actinomycetota bacterium]|nr:hypothetical protein [Actinomycetota bacterium]
MTRRHLDRLLLEPDCHLQVKDRLYYPAVAALRLLVTSDNFPLDRRGMRPASHAPEGMSEPHLPGPRVESV